MSTPLYTEQVDLIDMCDSGAEGALLRGALESFGARVHRFPIGRAGHLVESLRGAARSPYLLISAHGGEGGIYVPELAAQLAAQEPFDRLMAPEHVREHARLDHHPVVICSACESGRPELAGAFLDAGAGAFIGPTEPVLGTSALFALIHLFYGLLVADESLERALARVRARDRECALFTLTRR